MSALERFSFTIIMDGCSCHRKASQKRSGLLRMKRQRPQPFTHRVQEARPSSLIEKGSQMLASLLGGRDQAALASAVAKYAGLGQGAGGSCWPRSTTMLSPSAVHMSMRKVKCVRVPPSLPLSRRWQRLRGWWRRRLRRGFGFCVIAVLKVHRARTALTASAPEKAELRDPAINGRCRNQPRSSLAMCPRRQCWH